MPMKINTNQFLALAAIWLYLVGGGCRVLAVEEENATTGTKLLDMKLNHHQRRRLDQTFSDDLIVSESVCIGGTCKTAGSGESFGRDSLRFNENNIRIHFLDSSGTASFPRNEWRIIVNDDFNAGSDYFALEDATKGKIPFLVEAGAIENALVIGGDDDSAEGYVGFGTDDPQASLHVKSGECPALRLEKDSSAGFQPSVWEMRNTGPKLEFACDGKTIMSLDCGAPENSVVLNGSGILNFDTRRRVQEETEENMIHARQNPHSGVIKASEFTLMGTRGSATATVMLPQEVEGDYMVFLTAETQNVNKHYAPNVLARSSKGFKISLGDSAAELVQVNWLVHQL